MSYIEADYDHIRDVMHERSVVQGALNQVARVDDSGALKHLQKERPTDAWQTDAGGVPGGQLPGYVLAGHPTDVAREELAESPAAQFQHTALFTLMSTQLRAMSRRESVSGNHRAFPGRFTT